MVEIGNCLLTTRRAYEARVCSSMGVYDCTHTAVGTCCFHCGCIQNLHLRIAVGSALFIEVSICIDDCGS